MRRNSWPPDSPNTAYLQGHLLRDFIEDYCAAKRIFFDVDILNDVFLKRGFDASHVYSENEVIENINAAAAAWQLDDIAAQALQSRN